MTTNRTGAQLKIGYSHPSSLFEPQVGENKACRERIAKESIENAKGSRIYDCYARAWRYTPLGIHTKIARAPRSRQWPILVGYPSTLGGPSHLLCGGHLALKDVVGSSRQGV